MVGSPGPRAIQQVLGIGWTVCSQDIESSSLIGYTSHRFAIGMLVMQRLGESHRPLHIELARTEIVQPEPKCELHPSRPPWWWVVRIAVVLIIRVWKIQPPTFRPSDPGPDSVISFFRFGPPKR